MISLCRTLRDFGDEVEASLAFVGVDLLDLWRGRMSLRRLLVLIKALPADAPLWSALMKAQEEAEAEAKVQYLRERQAFWDKRRQEGA